MNSPHSRRLGVGLLMARSAVATAAAGKTLSAAGTKFTEELFSHCAASRTHRQ